MSPAFSEDKLDQIRETADIVEVIGRYVSLTRQGRYYKGLCPFHPEKTPSFTVNPERRIFKCFGCGEGGNVFSFLMKHVGMTFPEAVRELANSYHISLPSGPVDPREAGRAREREKLLRVCGLAQSCFTARLAGPEGGKVKAYLRQRGIPEEISEAYGLGWAVDAWQGLLDHLTGKRVPQKLIIEAGLALPGRTGRPYDRFRGRLMIPIRDGQGRVVAFGGRALKDKEGEPKYLNSSESPIFTKGRLLFGLSEARSAIRASGKVVVVEGYFDVLALASAGVGYAVASMGTALTGRQVRQLRGLAAEVILVYDGDAAGVKAALRAEEVFTKERVAAKILSLPKGLDPDDMVRERGGAAFEAELDRAEAMVAFAVNRLLDRPLETPEQKGAALTEVAPVLGRIASPVEQAAYVQIVAGRLGVAEAAVLAGLTRPGRSGAERTVVSQAAQAGRVETALVAAMVNDGACAKALAEAGVAEVLTDPVCRRVAEAVSGMDLAEGQSATAALLDRLDEEAARLVADLNWEAAAADRGAHLAQLVATVGRLKRRRLSNEIIDQISEAQAAGDEDRVMRLLAQKKALDRS